MYHPKSGLHYIHVIPNEWGPFVDVQYSYTNVVTRTHYISVITPSEFEKCRDTGYDGLDERYFFILWDHMINPGPRLMRKSCVVPVYSEAIGSNMLQEHIHVFNRFNSFSNNFDAIFGHTPWMSMELQERTGLAGHVFPMGWNPETNGVPRFNAPKHNDITFYGSIVGRRRLILPFIQEVFGSRFRSLNGSYSRGLIGSLDNSTLNIYVAHSDVESFSTWRIWQLISTSCCLVAEPGDCWPMIPDVHFYRIPMITMNNIDDVINSISDLSLSNPLDFAKKLYKDLGPEYTVDKCIENFLVPASLEIVENRLKLGK